MKLAPEWKSLLEEEFKQSYMRDLDSFLKKEYESHTIYPSKDKIFKALQLVDYDKVRVCILGQDPYHGPNQANGLAFAVNSEVTNPPSLKNIFKELNIETESSSLEGWARQGVLLLNTVLTVRASESLSHRKKGWEQFTDKVISELGSRKEPIVFLLWGSFAQSKMKLIQPHHKILIAPHPSPLSAHKGFLGCNHFQKVNEFLEKPIDWNQVD